MKDSRIIALDIGEKRIGVASASADNGFPSPLITIQNDDDVWASLLHIFTNENASQIVVGLPRSLQGDDTAQTEYTRIFVEELSRVTSLPIVMQDEALTSRKAEEELLSKKKQYAKGDIDALAATYILEDYLNQRGVNSVS